MTSQPPQPVAPGALRQLRAWFWRPPRAHGEIEEGRSVSFLELFSDLAWVVVIAQAAHHLAAHVTLRGYAEFAILFGVIWIAWANGTLYHDLHGRDDGRTRTFVFVQVAILALLAVFTADAAGERGQAFGLVYIAFLLVMTWLWYAVRRQDRPEYMATTARYLALMIASIAVIGLSLFLSPDGRLLVWGLFVAAWLVLMLAFGWHAMRRTVLGIVPTHAMVERFDLLVIIVLGETVVGVVNGLSGVEPDPVTLGTGFVALLVGFGLWWLFFDVAGRRLPRLSGLAVNAWMMGHLPVALAIIGAGAGMTGLIGHAHDPRTPVGTAWLVAGSVAMALVAIALLTRSLADWERHRVVHAPLGRVMVGAAGLALLIGWVRPVPWLLALTMAAILALVWLFAVARLLASGMALQPGDTGGGERGTP